MNQKSAQSVPEIKQRKKNRSRGNKKCNRRKILKSVFSAEL